MDKIINLGGPQLLITAEGADEVLTKLNLIVCKLSEVKTLLTEISSMKIEISLGEHLISSD